MQTEGLWFGLGIWSTRKRCQYKHQHTHLRHTMYGILIKRIRHTATIKEGYFEEVFCYHIVYYNSRLLFPPATITIIITITTIILELLLLCSLGFVVTSLYSFTHGFSCAVLSMPTTRAVVCSVSSYRYPPYVNSDS